jgi:adenylate kinase
MRLALLGPPGSGKGTQAAALGRHFNVPVVASGELLRTGAATGGDLWRDVTDRLARGELVPAELVVAVVNDAIEAAGSDGYILDGFPRTLTQAEHPDAPPVDAVVHLAVPDDLARERIARRAPSGRTDDASRAAVEHRLRAYHAETEPLLDLYRKRGVLRSVDASQPPDRVTADILRGLGTEPS